MRMRSLGSGQGLFLHPEEGFGLVRRGQVGVEKGQRGIAVTVGCRSWALNKNPSLLQRDTCQV